MSKRSGKAEPLEEALSALRIADRQWLIAFDTEGTSRTGGIREIGAVCIDDDDATFFDTVTQRGKAEGLSAADAARTWARVGPRFWAWVASCTPEGFEPVLVGHNCGSHDVPLLRSDGAHHGVRPPRRVRWADTLEAVRVALPELKRRDQRSVYAHLFGSEPPRHSSHTALADARACAAIARDARVRGALERMQDRAV
jgi:hypothetical protein